MRRYTFAGSIYLERMKNKGLYTIDRDEIGKRVRESGFSNVYE